jgi:hypothetical protein
VRAPPSTRKYSLLRELQNNLALKLRVPEDGLTVNGILRELEAQTPMIFNALLKSIFKAWDTMGNKMCPFSCMLTG